MDTPNTDPVVMDPATQDPMATMPADDGMGTAPVTPAMPVEGGEEGMEEEEMPAADTDAAAL